MKMVQFVLVNYYVVFCCVGDGGLFDWYFVEVGIAYVVLCIYFVC